MINPDHLATLVVNFLQKCPDVVRQVNDEPKRIYKYADSPSRSNSLSRAIYLAEVPSVLIAYQGTNVGNDGTISHNYSLFLRARDTDEPGVSTFAGMITAIANAMAVDSQDRRLIDVELTNDVYAIEPFSAQRIHDEEGRLDMFEMTTAITEKWDIFGKDYVRAE